MAFARTTAVAGTGTVSCTGTTTVTGSGTAFAFSIGGAPATNAPRVGGTITVGGVTKTITAIASATSLTTDTAFGTFTAQAFTTQTGITQTGTDTMNLSLGSATGFTITNRGDLYRIFDAGGQDLFIEGVLTVDSRVAQLRNDGSCSNRFEVRGSATGGEVIFNGRKAAAANAPFPYPGFDWLGQNGQKIMKLVSTNVLYPAKFTMVDACVRYGADWITTDLNNFSRITTQGDVCWILCARGTGTSQARLRQDNITASIDFQATKTFVGVWLNFGVPQLSLAGYTPIDTDGPEVNVGSVAIANKITVPNYNSTYVLPSYYAGAQWVQLGGAYVELKDNLKGTNIVWYSQSVSGGTYNVMIWSKTITIRAQDTAGNLLSDGYMYYQPVGANVANIRPKGNATGVTFDLTQQTAVTVAGVATSVFNFAWDFANGIGLQSSFNYFCTGTTKGAETHAVGSSRYGFDKQIATVSLVGNGATTPTYVHTSLPTTDKVIANAAAITGVAFNFGTKTITVTGTLSIQQIYDAYQYQLNQVANLQTADECTVANGQTYYVGWTINNSGTISAGTNLTTIRANTITNTGTITAVYQDSTGTSAILQLVGVTNNGVAAVWNPSTLATELFQTNVSGSPATYTLYYPPSATGTSKNYARELYGYQRVAGSITLAAGLNTISFVDIPDVGISQTNQATVLAYTAIETASKFYDRTAAFRLTEQGIKLGQIATRSGTSIEIGTFNHVINQSAAAVYAVLSGTITTKSTTYAGDSKYDTEIATPPATITAATTEVITIAREDANGDSQVTIQAAGVSTFEIWKITDATNPDNYATGTLVATVGIGTWRFLSANGFKFVIRDTTTNYRVVVEAEKGIYTAELFFGAQVQLAQAAEVTIINTKVDVLQNAVDAVTGYVDSIPTDVWTAPTRTLTSSSLTLGEIEASTILAKEASIVALGTPLQNSTYVAPANSDIASIKAKTDTLVNAPTVAEIEASTILAKQATSVEIKQNTKTIISLTA
jgi:hypothetical protein